MWVLLLEGVQYQQQEEEEEKSLCYDQKKLHQRILPYSLRGFLDGVALFTYGKPD